MIGRESDRAPLGRVGWLSPLAAWLLCALAPPPDLPAATVALRNGMRLRGDLGKIASIADNPLPSTESATGVKNQLIVLVDDGLRRTFVSVYQISAPPVFDADLSQERITFNKRLARGGRRVASVGPILNVTPFDEFGNRTISMSTAKGRIDTIQGITEITPTYTKVEGLLTQPKYSFVWEMRIATSSIPRATLTKILMRQIDPAKAEDRLRIVRLYIQSERFEDAKSELETALAEFPELADLKNLVKELRQRSATRLIEEIELRRDAGQHQLAKLMLRSFPEEGVAGETLLRVREILDEYARRADQAKRALELLDQHLGAFKDAEIRAQAEAATAEIAADLNINTLERMADYLRLSDDDTLTPEQKLSLAISGWVLGSGAGIENLAVSLSLFQSRDDVRSYLRSPRVGERESILQRLRGSEGVSPGNLAKLLASMRPPLEAERPKGAPPGLIELSTPGLEGDRDVVYYVQLPPEYDSYRRYPCVVALNSAQTTEPQEIDLWAGAYDTKTSMRLGQATRRGYIVIAPRWRKPHQSTYEYSAREHAAVLYSLRDAFRRFAIDTDRVFLAGHWTGGDAAWDIGLAHPDLWAGVLPISAAADKYIIRYWRNAQNVPFYFVVGDMDGDKLSRNGLQWDRYLIRSGFDTMVVAYKGRGHEYFHDEIQHLFDWMDLHRRDFFPREFTCVSMRPWDNFYWWSEAAEFPQRSMVTPVNWPVPKAREALTEGRVLENNAISLRTAAARAAVWLSPELVDFDRTISISINGRRRRTSAQPSIDVMLEDARTRSDRLHPFWAKVE